jgi:hypothetical protein
MRFFFRITGAPPNFTLEDGKGGMQNETVAWKVKNETGVDLKRVTFAPKGAQPYPFVPGSEDIVKTIKKGKAAVIQAKIADLDDGTYHFNLVQGPTQTVIGTDPDIEIAEDLGFLIQGKHKAVGRTSAKSAQLGAKAKVATKPAKKSGKASQPKKSSKRRK